MIWIYGGTTSYFNQLHGSCSTNYPWWMGILYAIFDFTICSVIQILFARRLLMAHLSTLHISQDLDIDKRSSTVISFDDNMNLSEEEQSEVVVILTKSTLLTFIAIITNQFALILSAFLQIPSLWLSLNACINCWCIILMFKCHNIWYSRLCGHCRRIISIRCLYCYSCDCLWVIDDGTLDLDNAANLAKEERSQHVLEVKSAFFSPSSPTDDLQ